MFIYICKLYSLNLSLKYIDWLIDWLIDFVQHIVIALYRLDRNRKLLKFLRILITTVYFKDRDWISKTVYCINCLMIKRNQAIAKRFAFYANTKNTFISLSAINSTVIINIFLLYTRFANTIASMYPAGNYMFKVNNRNTRTGCEICSKLTIKTQQWSLLLISNIFHTLF